jgi:transcription antitermination factor NusG
LALRGVEQFLPLYKEIRHWSDRKVCIEVPLFPGYLFVRMALRSRLRVLEVPGVARLIGFNGQPYALPEGEISMLREGIASALHIEPHPYLSEGCRVRIARGPLCGAEGLLVRKKNGFRVVLSLDLIAMSAAVEVDEADVKLIA